MRTKTIIGLATAGAAATLAFYTLRQSPKDTAVPASIATMTGAVAFIMGRDEAERLSQRLNARKFLRERESIENES